MKCEEMQEQLHIRLSKEDAAGIRARADKAGLTISEYVRKACLNKQIKEVSPELLSVLKDCSASMGRLGANMNQIARHLNSGGFPQDIYPWFEDCRKDMDDFRMRFMILVEKNLAA